MRNCSVQTSISNLECHCSVNIPRVPEHTHTHTPVPQLWLIEAICLFNCLSACALARSMHGAVATLSACAHTGTGVRICMGPVRAVMYWLLQIGG